MFSHSRQSEWMLLFFVFFFLFRFAFGQVVNESKRDFGEVMRHTVFIQQLIWMYYFIHELFPDFLKQ